MYAVITVLIIIVSILLVLIVLVQNSKGGGLASNFSSSNQYMGVRKTADFLEKATWTLAIALLVLSLASVMAIKRPGGGLRTDLKQITDMPTATVPPAAQTGQENTGLVGGGQEQAQTDQATEPVQPAQPAQPAE
ncbi:MAG TPA: preprotein translocase subunit SecG [Bacteroidales bacterium]|nr:preprotein translocase subunit SecG [Bacteroidales bacterium]HRZ48422.1 preprotein translocase subunit SecG [Bacteroidales bacterium]